MKALDAVIQYATPVILVIAQSIPIPDVNNSIVMEAVRSLGVLIVLAWYLWYTTSVSNPKILDAAAKEREASATAHRAERESITAAHKLESDQKRTDFLQAMACQRQEFQSSLTHATDAFKVAVDRIACKFENRDPPCTKT